MLQGFSSNLCMGIGKLFSKLKRKRGVLGDLRDYSCDHSLNCGTEWHKNTQRQKISWLSLCTILDRPLKKSQMFYIYAERVCFTFFEAQYSIR